VGVAVRALLGLVCAAHTCGISIFFSPDTKSPLNSVYLWFTFLFTSKFIVMKKFVLGVMMLSLVSVVAFGGNDKKKKGKSCSSATTTEQVEKKAGCASGASGTTGGKSCCAAKKPTT
jgi:hypothetical protein